MVDHVYRKPMSRVDVVFLVQPESNSSTSTSILLSPQDRALLYVLTDCLKQQVNKEIGYEANLASIEYSAKGFEDQGLQLRFEGYSDKLFVFATKFLEIMKKCAREGGFPLAQVKNSYEVRYKRYKNANVDVETRCNNNRLLFLQPGTFHASHMEHLLKPLISAETISSEFCPGKFLAERILGKIGSMRVLITGNTSIEQAKEFCMNQLISQFNL